MKFFKMSLIRKKNAEIKNWIIQVGFKKNPHLQKALQLHE